MVRSRALLGAAFLVASCAAAAADQSAPVYGASPVPIQGAAAKAPDLGSEAREPAVRLSPDPDSQAAAPQVGGGAEVKTGRGGNGGADQAAAPAQPAPVGSVPEAALAAFVKSAEETPAKLRNEMLRRRRAIADFYAVHGDRPLWLRDGQWSEKARAAVARLERADDDGLDARALSIPDLSSPGDGSQWATELALTDAAVLYGEEASGGRINPRLVSNLIAEPHTRLAPDDILSRLAESDDVAKTLDSFNPPQAGYRALRAELLRLRASATPRADARVPPGRMLRLGMRDTRVPILRKRLGLPAPASASESRVYDRSVMEAVREFQRSSGIPASGLLTARTVAALAGPTDRIAEIVANMEFWRWTPRDLGVDRIEVNIPEYTLRLFHGDKIVREARVVVGKASTPTPIFSNAIRYVIVNPSWNVPQSIIRKEMLPKLAADPDYLLRLGYVVTYKGDVMEVRQPPGDHNALGRIKFLFPNDYAVYLHDTPERALFKATARDFSHGCVRVQDPFALGQDVLGAANGWSEARLKKLIGDRERTIRLPAPLPIHLEYFTAFVGDKGDLEFRPDVYGYARKVERDLGLLTMVRRPVKPRT